MDITLAKRSWGGQGLHQAVAPRKINYFGSWHQLHLVFHSKFNVFQFMGILKPNYNSVDLTEVEHVDDDSIVLGSSHPDIIKVGEIRSSAKYYDSLTHENYTEM